MKRIKLKFQKDLINQIALLQVKGIGPIILRKMLLQFETAENIMLADKSDFIEKNFTTLSFTIKLRSQNP